MEEYKPTEDISELSEYKLNENREEKLPVERKDTGNELSDDFDMARDNIKDILDQGNDVLENMIELAKASDSPRAFEVASTLMKTLIDANKDLIDIHDKKKKIQGVSIENQSAQTINNNTIVSSPAEIAEMLRQQKEKDITEE